MKEFKGKSIEDLKAMLVEKREALRVSRFEIAGGKVKNVKAGRVIRTAIARILTEINTPSSK